MSRIYLDSAAATPMSQKVLDAMLPYFVEKYHNPSALYEGARQSKASLEQARTDVAKLLGARQSEIVFTAGGTESANLAINGIMSRYPDGEVLISSIEHDAVMKPAEEYKHLKIAVDDKARLDIDDLKNAVNDKTVLISVMLANNEVGTLQPIKEIVEIVQHIRKQRKQSGNELPLYVHTDACQVPMYGDVHVARLGVDLMTLNGGKIHGPKQSGTLYVRSGVVLSPVVRGGGQEWGMRSGTENVAFAVGFAKALELAEKGKADRVAHVSKMRDYFITELEEKFNATLNGHKKSRLAHNVHVTFSDTDNERVLFALDDLGVDAAAGSACSASSDTSSHVLLAMGRSDDEVRSSVRFSFLSDVTKEQLDQALKHIESALKA